MKQKQISCLRWLSSAKRSKILSISMLFCLGAPLVYGGQGRHAQTQSSTQIVNLQAGKNTEISVQDSLFFYDDGGADAKFSPKFDGSITFAPAKPGEIIKLIFKNFNIGSKSTFLVYEGGEISPDALKANIANPNVLVPTDFPLPLFSTSADGKLTIHFSSTATQFQVEAGWEILVVSALANPLSVKNVAVSSINEEFLLGNTEHNLFLKIAISLDGDTSHCTLNKLEFSTDGSTSSAAITKANLFYSERTNSLTPDLGNTIFEHKDNTLQLTFSGDLILDRPTTYYLWLAYDLGEVKENEKIAANLVSYTINGEKINVNGTPAVSTTQKGVHGKFIIGESEAAQYKSLQAAIDHLVTGIDGPVVLELENGQYEGPFLLPEIKGSSATNTITICGQSENFKDVIIYSNQYIKESNKPTGVFNILGADHVILKNLSFTSTDLTYPQLLCIKNSSRFVQVSHCHFSSLMTNGKDYSKTTNLIYTTAENIADKNSDFLTFSNNVLDGGYIGLNVGGTGYLALPKQKGVNIHHNSFTNQGFKSIYVRDQNDVAIYENTIVNNATDKSGFQAMDLYKTRNQVRVYNNDIKIKTNFTAIGIEMRPLTGTPENRAQVYNNVINFEQTKGLSYGMLIADNSAYIDIAHNTIHLYDTLANASAAAISFKDTVTDLKFSNNIIDNASGGYVFRLGKVGSLAQIEFWKNALYTSNTNTFAIAGKNTYASFNLWQNSTTDNGSIEHKAKFYSTTFLALKSGEALRIGETIPFASTDILGVQRHSQYPTLGAYEFEIPSADKPLMADNYPQIVNITPTSIELKVKFNQSGSVYALAKPSDESAPSIDEVLTQIGLEITKDKETKILLSNLIGNQKYNVFIVAKNYNDTLSTLIISDTIHTEFSNTKVSDFENIPLGTTVFTDGTASFSNFEIIEASSIISNSKHAAKVLQNASIQIDNTSTGLVLSGFFIHSSDSLTIHGFDAEGTKKTKKIEATQNNWIYCNLKDLGALIRLELVGNGTTLIDNFSDNPLPLSNTITGNFKITQGTSTKLSVSTEGGVPPYTYLWKENFVKEISTTNEVTIKSMTTGQYTLEIEDAWKNRDSIEFTVFVFGDSLLIADFENLDLNPESYWKGSSKSKDGNSLFYSGSFSFNNNYTSSWDAWNQFAYSNVTDSTFDPNQSTTHQFRSAAGGGFGKSGNFGVIYDMGPWGTPPTIEITGDTNGRILNGMYINNNAWSYNAAVNGDNFAGEAFTQGDYFSIEIYGIRTNDTVKLTHYLSDFRHADTSEHYVNNTWEWVDLSKLGAVKSVFFHTKSSRTNDYGELFPAYFCIDNFNGNFLVETEETSILVNDSVQINLNDLFPSFQHPQAHLNVEILSGHQGKVADVQIKENQLEIKGLLRGTQEIMLKGSQRGQSQYMQLSVLVKERINTTSDALKNEQLFQVYPIPSTHTLNIQSELESYHIEVISLQGEILLKTRGNSHLTALDIQDLKTGTYIIRIYSEDVLYSSRFVKF